MSKMKIGLQLYSIRDAMQADFYGTLKKVKEMGYDAVEFAGLFDNTPQQVKAWCDELGLEPISAHVGYGEVVCKTQWAIDTYCKIIGCRYIVIPACNVPMHMPTKPEHDNFLREVGNAGKLIHENRATLLYHNHDREFEKVNGENLLDLMYAEFAPEILQTQIDTCWAKVGGEDPAAYVLKYTGRAPLVHLKDYFGEKSGKMYELIDGTEVEDTGERKPFELRAVGRGCQDVKAILEASEKAGAECVIVEQDEHPGSEALADAKYSIDYIRSIY